MVATRWGVSITGLRYPLVRDITRDGGRFFGEHVRSALEADPRRQAAEGFSYLDVSDAARATVAALLVETPAAPGILVAAPLTYLSNPTDEALQLVAPPSPAPSLLTGGGARPHAFPGAVGLRGGRAARRHRARAARRSGRSGSVTGAAASGLDADAGKPTVSLLGLGPMGEPMARNLLAGNGSLIVWNRTAAKAQSLAALGAVVAATPREAAAEVTLTVLPDLRQVRELLSGHDGLLAGWAERGIEHPVLVVHGTVSPVAVADFAAELRSQHGVVVLDAPLSGGTVGAADGTLSIMIGGDKDAIQAVMPLFLHMGRTVRVLGESGAGQLAKACNQIVVA